MLRVDVYDAVSGTRKFDGSGVLHDDGVGVAG